jgi:UDP-N-acetylglucosamine 2-epimerase (non-hydrolysing)
MKLMLVLGTRPQIIKSAPLIREILDKSEIEIQIVHTGQHYDFEMSKVFFDELKLPDPLVNLGVGSGGHAWQTGKMMINLERVMLKLKPDLVLVPGDTNSTLAGALVAVKLHVPLGHVEAGARSYDMRMPEEVNRRLTDHCSRLLFAPTLNCVKNLRKEGLPSEYVHFSGDTMYDSLLRHLPKALKSNVLDRFDLEKDDYGIVTLHRPENVDNTETLKNIVEALIRIKDLVLLFPVHPRAMKMLRASGLLKCLRKAKHLRLVDPIGYLDMLHLVKEAKIILTDSGGLQKEAFWLHTPCLTLRDRTEWVETVQLGANVLVGDNQNLIVRKAREYLTNRDLKAKLEKLPNPFGHGDASGRILEALEGFNKLEKFI